MGVNQTVINNVAGLIDAGENYIEAATRELFEETGLTLTRVLETMSPTFSCAGVTDDMSRLIICEAEGKIRESDSPDEEIDARWYSKEEVKALLESDEHVFSGRTQSFCWTWVNDI